MLTILTVAGGRELGDIKDKANSGLDPCPPSCEVLSSKLILMFVPCQIPPKARSTVTGCTEYSGTRPPALATGPAGTEPPQSSSALVDCSTTRRLMPATGLRMLLAARNIVISITSANSAVLTLNSSALCNEDRNGNVPLGKSCNRYWACQGGYPRLQRCPAMLVFDKNRRRCVTPPTEDCEVPTTKAPPPGEENENNFPSGLGDQPQQSPNPRRGGGQRRPPPPRPVGGEPLPFNLPPGAVPLNEN